MLHGLLRNLEGKRTIKYKNKMLFVRHSAPTISAAPPLNLLRILSADEMRASRVEKSDITNKQVSLFDSQ